MICNGKAPEMQLSPPNIYKTSGANINNPIATGMKIAARSVVVNFTYDDISTLLPLPYNSENFGIKILFNGTEINEMAPLMRSA